MSKPSNESTQPYSTAHLSPEALYVTQQKGTERPFTSEFNDHAETGMYHCVVCDHALFSSAHKFDAGCGWPSFYEQDVAQNVVFAPDHSHGMRRTEILCKHCGAHLGHVFDDGPAPTGQRYCVNGISLQFHPE
jgi:peptide-methionine (R)-S-oxide reductase